MFAFELDFLKWLEGFRTDFCNLLFEGITAIGEETLMIVIVVTLWFAVNRKLGQKILFLTASSLSINVIVKNLTAIPRPFTRGISCVRPDSATGYSFPSGHTQMFSTWSTLFAIRYKKLWFSLLTGLLIALVAFSRLYLGAHYPSDVIVGIGLGVGLAFLGDLLFEKIKDTKKLYLGTLIVFTPFVLYFLIEAEHMYEDLYKLYGMIGGLTLVSFLEEKCEALSYDVPWWKKLLRIVIGVAAAFVLKEGIKALNVFEAVPIALLFDTLRYFVVIFTLGYVCPLLFRKIKL